MFELPVSLIHPHRSLIHSYRSLIHSHQSLIHSYRVLIRRPTAQDSSQAPPRVPSSAAASGCFSIPASTFAAVVGFSGWGLGFRASLVLRVLYQLPGLPPTIWQVEQAFHTDCRRLVKACTEATARPLFLGILAESPKASVIRPQQLKRASPPYTLGALC